MNLLNKTGFFFLRQCAGFIDDGLKLLFFLEQMRRERERFVGVASEQQHLLFFGFQMVWRTPQEGSSPAFYLDARVDINSVDMKKSGHNPELMALFPRIID